MIWRALSRVGWGLGAAVLLLSICAWLVYSRYVQLDKDNRQELAHAGHELAAILQELTSTADRLYVTGNKVLTPDQIERFQLGNPYVRDYPTTPVNNNGRDAFRNCHPDERKTVDNSWLESPQNLVIPTKRKDDPTKRGIELPVSPESIFDDVVISRAFEYLFIANREGKVIFEAAHGASGQRRAERPWLTRRAEGASQEGHPTIRLELINALESTPGSELDSQTLLASSGTRSIRLGDHTYQLYYFPFKVTGVKASETKGDDSKFTCAQEITWVVGGLVDPQQMRLEALTISQEWMLLLFFVLVLVVVGQPFVKLLILSPSERFRFADACFLTPSAVVMLALGTALLLDAGSYSQLKSQAGEGMADLALRVQRNLTDEFRQMHAQLTEYDNTLAARLDGNCSDWEARHALANNKESPTRYQDFAQAFWLDFEGTQSYKVTVHGASTGQQKLAERAYFTEARDGHWWRFSSTEEQFFVQSYRSFTTGDVSTALAIKSKAAESAGPGGCLKKEETLVAVISGKPLSVERPLLPAGVSFAIIESSGRVIYHSDRRRILKENLFDELGDPAKLQAAVQSGTPQRFDTTYARRATEVFVRPFDSIEGSRWSVVAFRDEQWLDTVNSEGVLRTVFWLLCALAPTFVPPLILLAAGKGFLRHLWPDAKQAWLYRVLALAYGVCFLVGLTGAALLSGMWLFSLTLGFPLFVTGMTVVLYRQLRRRGEQAKADATAGYRHWYFVAVLGCWVCFSMVPAIGLFRHAWSVESAKFQHLEEQRAREHRKSWIARDEYETRSLKVAQRQNFLLERHRYLNAYQQPLPRPVDIPDLDAWLDTILPFYNETAERLRYQTPSSPGPSSTPDTYLESGVGFTWWTILGLLLTPLVAWWWLQYIDRHLLWSKLAWRQTLQDPLRLFTDRARFITFLTPSDREKRTISKLFTTNPTYALSGAYPGVAILGPPGTPDKSSPLRVDDLVENFEEMIASFDLRRTTLEELEQSVATDASRAVIVSRTDPLQFLTEDKDLDPDVLRLVPHMSSAERDRWLRVLEPFETHVIPAGWTEHDSKATAAHGALGTSDAYCHSLWRFCSLREKLTLIHVAEEGFAKPHQRTVERLVEKGLLVFDPHLKLMSPEFERFVIGRTSSPQVKSWEQSEGQFGWARARWIVLLLVLGTLTLFATMQGAWFKGVATLLTGVAAGLESLSQLLRAAQRSHQALK